MKVFITGATGYIGFSVARAMRRAGHQIWGLTRSTEKARDLIRNEINPVTGNMQDPDSYLAAAEQCSVLIHAASDYEQDTVELDRNTIDAFLQAGEQGAWPKTVIYTSGCWVIGDTGDGMVDETVPLNPIEAVSWRPAHENLILQAEHIKGLVIRPGCVYGERGGLTGMWFKGAAGDELEVIGDGSNYWTMVHVDDLADAYVNAAESGLIAEDFNISDRSRWTVREMAEAAAGAAGYEGDISYIPVNKAAAEIGPVAEALALNQHVDAGKAERLLNWYPKHRGFVDEAELYFKSWKANNHQRD